MGLMEFVILTVLVGLGVWLIQNYTPIDQKFKTLITIVCIVVLVVILLKAMGLFGFDTPIPRFPQR